MKRPDIATLQKQIRRSMVDREIRSEAQLAKQAGLNVHTFHNFFKQDRKYSLYADDLYLIANTLEKPMEELLTGVQKVERQPLMDARAEEITQLLENIPSDGLDALLTMVRALAGNASQTKRNGTEG